MTGLAFFAAAALAVYLVDRRRSRRERLATPRQRVATRPVTAHCADCGRVQVVTTAGRCATCQSAAVAVRGNTYQAPAGDVAAYRRRKLAEKTRARFGGAA